MVRVLARIARNTQTVGATVAQKITAHLGRVAAEAAWIRVETTVEVFRAPGDETAGRMIAADQEAMTAPVVEEEVLVVDVDGPVQGARI